MTGKGTGITLDEPTQGTVTIFLTVGDDVYCSTCTAPRRDEPGRYRATRCPAPASCAVTTTTSTSSTTTSTFVPGVCGNGVVDQSSEECDAPDAGACDAINVPCCGTSQCQLATGAGAVMFGTCIPPSCTDDADCNGYRCVDGTCCGNAGQSCGVAECCPDSGATCETVPWQPVEVCCRPTGTSCGAPEECCSGSCTSGACD